MNTFVASIVNKLANATAIVFIGGLAILGITALLGIWDYLEPQFTYKSFDTIGILILVTAVVLIGSRFIEKDQVFTPMKVFPSVRRISIGILILAVSLLALLGILAIWDVIEGDLISDALSSLGVITAISFLIIIVCLDREAVQDQKREFSVWKALGWFVLIIFVWVVSLLFRFSLF